MAVQTSLAPWEPQLPSKLVVRDNQGFDGYGTAVEAANFERHAGCTKLARRR